MRSALPPRGLEQHDVGPEPRQQPARERTRLVGQVEHAQPSQEARRHSVTKSSRTASSVSCETLVTRSLSSASVADAARADVDQDREQREVEAALLALEVLEPGGLTPDTRRR